MAAPLLELWCIDLEIKGEEMQKDWDEFVVTQQQNAVDRIFSFFRSRACYSFVVLRLAMDLALGFTWYNLFFGSMSTYVLACTLIANIAQPAAFDFIRRHPQVSATVQLCMIFILEFTVILTSLSMDDPIAQHRLFLTSQTTTMLIVSTAFFIPIRVHLAIGFPLLYGSWLVFHALIGYVKVSVIIFGCLICGFAPLIAFQFREKVQWQLFRANRQLDREREILKATQNALHCMLSSLWDASCTCDMTGTIVSSTPHLEQLLNGGQDLIGESLCSFAADEADASRLQAFLKNTASVEQALALQCSLNPRVFGSHQDKELKEDVFIRKAASYEVALYGIKVPLGAAVRNSSPDNCSNILFIGIKASVIDTILPDASTCSMPSALVQSARRPSNVDDVISLGDSASMIDPQILPSEHESSLGYSASMATSNKTSARMVKPPLVNGATQTERLQIEGLSGITILRIDACTQTLSTVATFAAKPPRSQSKSGDEQVECEPNISIFGLTPSRTMHKSLMNMSQHWNIPRNARSCCSFHDSLQHAQRLFRSKRYQECRPLWSANTGWQCHSCEAMNHRRDEICGLCSERSAAYPSTSRRFRHLCPGLVVPSNTECRLAVPVLESSSQSYDNGYCLRDLNGSPALRIDVGQSWHSDEHTDPFVTLRAPSSENAQTDDSLPPALACCRASCESGCEQIVYAHGAQDEVYCQIAYDIAKARYNLVSKVSGIRMAFAGNSQEGTLKVTNRSGELLAFTEPYIAAFDSERTYYLLVAASNVDIALVLCGLLGIDYLERH